nr:MAG: hypothetical protein [Bacteriophage sp.]
MNIKNRIKVSISNIPKAVKPIPGIQDSLITRSGRVFLKERGVWYEIIPKMNTSDCIRNGNFFLPKPRYGKENNLYGKRGSKSPRSVVTKEVHTCIMYLHRLGYNKRSLSRILLLHPNTINRVLNKPQDYEY